MANRQHPLMVATRVTPIERAMIDAAAEARGVSVTALLRGIVLPAVGREVEAHAATLTERGKGWQDHGGSDIPAAA